ncbi:MAG: RidA family protein [Pseudooceanicola sp.]|nr:RidA family protein [Pseudooceanicola sp.]
MKLREIASEKAPETVNYAPAVELTGHERLLFVSGQIPVARGGAVAEGFAAQTRQVWANILHHLEAAGMDYDNVVKVTTYLSSHEHRMEYRALRDEILGGRRPALTVVICDIFDPAWLLEVDVIAAA